MNRYRLVSLASCAVGAGLALVGPGEQMRAGSRAIALVALAGVGALIAGRGLLRRAVAVVVLLAGVGMTFGGPATAIIGGLLVAVGGAVAVVTCPGWDVLGVRYERGGKAGEPDMWAALDRGEDPTAT